MQPQLYPEPKGLTFGSAGVVRQTDAVCGLGPKLRLRDSVRQAIRARRYSSRTVEAESVDFVRGEVQVREGKGNKDRVTALPLAVRPALAAHLDRVRGGHPRDLQQGDGQVPLPAALSRKYPNADRELEWCRAFPAAMVCCDPRWTSVPVRDHLHGSAVQRAVRTAAREASLIKPVGPHMLRHCFATHLLEAGHDIRTVQELLGHPDVKRTTIYARVLSRGGRGVQSPADRLGVTKPDNEPAARRLAPAWPVREK